MGTNLVTEHLCGRGSSGRGLGILTYGGVRAAIISAIMDQRGPAALGPTEGQGPGPLTVTGCQLHPFLLYNPHTVVASP